jgi:hypothetical protein
VHSEVESGCNLLPGANRAEGEIMKKECVVIETEHRKSGGVIPIIL